MRVFHRGLIIVGVPFLLALFLSITLFLVLNQAEQERLSESKLLRINSLSARYMALVSQAPYVLMAAVNLKSEDLFKQADQKFRDIEKLWPELLLLSGQNKGSKPSDLESARKSMDDLLGTWKLVSKERGVPADKYTPTVFSGLMGARSALMNALYKTLPQETELRESQLKLEQLKHMQLVILAIALLLNVGVALFLLLFYKRGILDRIGQMLANTKSLASKEWLAPEMGGDDEIAQFDHAFHATRKMIMRASEAEKSLFNNTSDVICVLDAEFFFIRVNPASAKSWEYEPDEVRGRNLAQFIDEGSFEKIKSILGGKQETEQTASLEALVNLKSGKQQESLWSIYWSAVDRRLYCIVHDISERKRIERIKKQFMLMVSTDLQTPLQEIDSEVEQLASGAVAVPAPASEKFIALRKNIARLLDLVDEILQVAMVDKDMLAIEEVEIEVKELLERAIGEVENLASARKLKLELEPCPGRIFGDPDKILQVLVNLLSNAIKFSPEEKSISISAEPKGATVLFKVSDQGRGIPKNKIATIFEKFSQVQLADGKRRSGIGLGLPICKQIVEAHRGKIGAESEVDGGSTFWFSIPAEPRSSELDSARLTLKEAARSKRGSVGASSPDEAVPEGRTAKPSGNRLSLVKVGLVLVAVPVLFELLFVTTLFVSFIRIEQERSREINQREIAITASRLLRLMSLFTAATDAGAGAARSTVEAQRPNAENLPAEWDQCKDRLAKLLAASPELKDFPAIKQSSADMIQLAAHLQDSYTRSVQMLGPQHVRVGESVYSQVPRREAIQDAVKNLPRNKYFLMKRRERLEPQLQTARQEEEKAKLDLDKLKLPLFSADKGRLDSASMDYERRKQHREELETALNEVIESQRTLEETAKADVERLRRENLNEEERNEIREKALPESAGDLLRLVEAAAGLGAIVEKAESGGLADPAFATQSLQKQIQVIIGGLVVDVLVSLLLAFQFNQLISRRLNVLVENASLVAQGKPLNPLLEGNDELADLDRSFQASAEILLESRRKERAVFDNCKDMVCIISPAGKFSSVNPAVESLLGYKAGELLDRRAADLVAAEDQYAMQEKLLFVQESDSEGVLDCRMIHKDESYVHTHWSYSRKKGQTPIICTVRDETDQKELERLRQEFLALVSHELRTPLTAIEGVCQLSQQGVFGEFSDEALTVTAMIRKNIRALLNVVNDILDLEKVEAGMMKFDKQEVLLQSLVDALTQNLASVIPASQTFFEVGSDEGFEERTFLADKERLCQSLSSLCKYLHYRNCSGKISIQAERRAQGVRFRISDSGPPVEAKVRQDLFNRFKEHSSRGSSASNFNADLALPLSARIIEAHGGKVILKVGNDESNVFVAALVNEE